MNRGRPNGGVGACTVRGTRSLSDYAELESHTCASVNVSYPQRHSSFDPHPTCSVLGASREILPAVNSETFLLWLD